MGMQKPSNSEEAVMQAILVLNSVSVPFGGPPDDANFFGGVKTQWQAVWDHKNRILYWRSHSNQNMQRVRLADMDIGEGGTERQLETNSPQLPWFNDASPLFQPKK